jgi:hypothetical protein
MSLEVVNQGMSVGQTKQSERAESTLSEDDVESLLLEFARQMGPNETNVSIRSVQNYGSGESRYCNIPERVASPQDDVMVAEFGRMAVIIPFDL